MFALRREVGRCWNLVKSPDEMATLATHDHRLKNYIRFATGIPVLLGRVT